MNSSGVVEHVRIHKESRLPKSEESSPPKRIQQDSYDLGDLVAFGSAENESGYSSKMECDYFGDLNESFTKEKMNTSAEENDQTCLDQFSSFKRKRRPSIEEEDKFNKLPDEMILMILEWLPMECLVRSMLVCKRWCQIARDEALWARLDLRNKVFNKGTLGHILPRGVRNLTLKKVNIADPVFCEGSEVLSDSYISKLEYLFLCKAVISPVGLAALLSKCKHLKLLLLEKCVVNRDCCRMIYQNTELEILSLYNCKYIDNIDIGCILMKLKCLTHLNLKQMEIPDPVFCEDSEVLSDSYINNLKYMSLHMVSISSVGLAALLSKCNLRFLFLMEMFTVNRDCCRAIIQNSELANLHLHMCHNIDIEFIMDLTKLKCLTGLSIEESLDNERMTLLCRTLPISIENLNIADYGKVITDDNIKDLTKSCPNIKYLHLHNCYSLTMRTVHFLLNLSKLRRLAVFDCHNIPPSGHTELTRMPGLLWFDTDLLEY